MGDSFSEDQPPVAVRAGWYPNPGGGIFAKTRFWNGQEWTDQFGDEGVGIVWPDRSRVTRTAPAAAPDVASLVRPPYPGDPVADPSRSARPYPTAPGSLLRLAWSPLGAVALIVFIFAFDLLALLGTTPRLVGFIPQLWLEVQLPYLIGAWNRWNGRQFVSWWVIACVVFSPIYIVWAVLAPPYDDA